MKRLLRLFALSLLLLRLPLCASGAENAPFETAGDLWEHWCEDNRVPDFITGVWSTDGSHENLTFGLVPGEEGERAKELILSWIADDSSVTFATQTWSRNYLLSILEDVNTYFDKGLGFTTAGLNDYGNAVFIELHTDYESNPDSLAAVEELEEKYGSAVSISFTATVYHTTLDLAVASEPPMLTMLPANPVSPASPLPILLILCIPLLCALMLTERRRRQLLTHMGALEPAPLTTRQVEEQVRASAPEVPDGLRTRIDAALDELTD